MSTALEKPRILDENKDPEPFWKEGEYAYKDAGDALIPHEKGFISDMVYYLRGYETPTVFCIWTALFLLANALKRDAWVKWGDDTFYSNLYIVLVGEAGHVKKTTAVLKGIGILKSMKRFLEKKVNRHLAAWKSTAIIENKATPEAILNEAFNHARIPLKDEDGHIIKEHGKAAKRAAEITIVVPEMSVMFNKQTYNESLMQNMLDLYDPHDEWGWATKTDGKRTIKKLLTNMIAATTKDGFRDALPRAALGDGFLSRVLLIYQERTQRIFDLPMMAQGAPDKEEMARRLAYIGLTFQGEVAIEPKARTWFKKWYFKNRKQQDKVRGSVALVSRKPIMMLKLAMLIAAQRYSQRPLKPVIILEDFKDALRLLNAAYGQAPIVLRELRGDANEREYNRMVNAFSNLKQPCTKRELMQASHIRAMDATQILNQLYEEGRLLLFHEDGSEDPDGVITASRQLYGLESTDDKE